MAEEFGGFVAADLMNQKPRCAVARVGPRNSSFNLEVSFLPEPERTFEAAYAEVLRETRNPFCTPRSTIREELAALRSLIPPERGADPFQKIKARQDKERKEGTGDGVAEAKAAPPESKPVEESTPPAGTPAREESPEKSEAIKNQIIQMAGNWGYSYQTEKPILGGATRVDLSLSLGAPKIACQITVTTPIPKEIENLKRCLQAGYQEVALVCNATVKRRSIEERFRSEHGPYTRVRFLTVRQFVERLEVIAEEARKAPVTPGVGEPPKATAKPTETVPLSVDEKEAVMRDQLLEIKRRIQRAKGRSRP